MVQVSAKDIIQNVQWDPIMETSSALLAICARNSPVISKFPATKASDMKF